MSQTSAELRQRLARLESFLQQDSTNHALRHECVEIALQLRDWPRAQDLVQQALAKGDDPLVWGLRQAECMMAQHNWPAAQQALNSLRMVADGEPALQAALAHDLAFVALHVGDFEVGREHLAAALAEIPPDHPLPQATQVLWLRLLHRTQRVEEAVAWAGARAQAGALDLEASGVASLAALDCGDYPLALQWADTALNAGHDQFEALVTRSSLALAESNADLAMQLAQRAIQLNATDGRVWSAWAFGALLAQRIDDAEAGFQRAVQYMPRHISTWQGLGWCQITKGQHLAAQAAFSQALGLDHKNAESHGGLAVTHAMLGNRRAAETYIARALDLDQACFSAAFAQTVLSGAARDSTQFRRLAEKLLEKRPNPIGSKLLDRLPRSKD